MKNTLEDILKGFLILMLVDKRKEKKRKKIESIKKRGRGLKEGEPDYSRLLFPERTWPTNPIGRRIRDLQRWR